MIKKLYIYFSKPRHLSLLNASLIALLVISNWYFQAFCIPTTWTIIVLAICFVNTIISPLFTDTRIAPISSFISGISLFVFLYCVLFLEWMNTVAFPLILIGIGLVLLIPHFFIVQLVWRNGFKPRVKNVRYSFLTAIVLCIGTVLFVGNEYKKAMNEIEKFESSNFTVLEKNFMTEKILGMHFIYHTRIDIYDGWRPPKHEPILVVGMWMNNRIDPLNVDLASRLALYKQFFPENKYKFECSCGMLYRESYHNSDLWE